MTTKKKQIAILGSTGSIGTQALEVISEHPSLFEVEVLTANNNSSLLIEQAKKFKPNTVVITNEEKYKEVDNALFGLGIKVFCGEKSLEEVVEGENIDVAMDGSVIFSYGGKGYFSATGNAVANSFTALSGAGNTKLPSGSARTDFAFAPSDDNYIYAWCAGGSGGSVCSSYPSRNDRAASRTT